MIGKFRAAGFPEDAWRVQIGFRVGLRVQNIVFQAEPAVCASVKGCWLYFSIRNFREIGRREDP